MAELGSKFELLGDVRMRFDVRFFGDELKFRRFEVRSVQVRPVQSSVFLGSFHHYPRERDSVATRGVSSTKNSSSKRSRVFDIE